MIYLIKNTQMFHSNVEIKKKNACKSEYLMQHHVVFATEDVFHECLMEKQVSTTVLPPSA